MATVSRRDVIKAPSALALGGAFQNQSNSPDPWTAPGALPRELGTRAPQVALERRVNRRFPSGESETPLHLLDGIITPADLHFERHHAGGPAIDQEIRRRRPIGGARSGVLGDRFSCA